MPSPVFSAFRKACPSLALMLVVILLSCLYSLDGSVHTRSSDRHVLVATLAPVVPAAQKSPDFKPSFHSRAEQYLICDGSIRNENNNWQTKPELKVRRGLHQVIPLPVYPRSFIPG